MYEKEYRVIHKYKVMTYDTFCISKQHTLAASLGILLQFSHLHLNVNGKRTPVCFIIIHDQLNTEH